MIQTNKLSSNKCYVVDNTRIHDRPDVIYSIFVSG